MGRSSWCLTWIRVRCYISALVGSPVRLPSSDPSTFLSWVAVSASQGPCRPQFVSSPLPRHRETPAALHTMRRTEASSVQRASGCTCRNTVNTLQVKVRHVCRILHDCRCVSHRPPLLSPTNILLSPLLLSYPLFAPSRSRFEGASRNILGMAFVRPPARSLWGSTS